MQKSHSDEAKFWIIGVITIVSASAALAGLWPLGLLAANRESRQLVTEGDQASGGEAESDYQLATWLNSHNQSAYEKLAIAQINLGQPEAALASLSKAGDASSIATLKVRTLIELGHYNDAANAASGLTLPSATQSNLVLAAMAYGLVGRTSDLSKLSNRVSSPEATQAISRAESGKLPLATDLYATGLLNSSNALLVQLPVSFERNLLLGRIYFTRHNGTNITSAQKLVTTAVTLNPSSIEARQLLSKIYVDQKQAAQANQQNVLIAKLQAGRQ